ncbi:DUF5110 domain-containing protein [uncultured Prevotella sp.]|uniref:DUF5110 domain-containing protein n=1 Tax=uncultured Prevotella sp. TaxID=159272 RepID=UPI00338E62D1
MTFQWNDKARTLTIGERKGSYPGMLQKRQFTIVTPNGKQKVIEYNGQKMQVSIAK